LFRNLFLTPHTSRLTVGPAGEGSTVTWAVDVVPDELLDMLVGTYQGALEALKAHLDG